MSGWAGGGGGGSREMLRWPPFFRPAGGMQNTDWPATVWMLSHASLISTRFRSAIAVPSGSSPELIRNPRRLTWLECVDGECTNDPFISQIHTASLSGKSVDLCWGYVDKVTSCRKSTP